MTRRFTSYKTVFVCIVLFVAARKTVSGQAWSQRGFIDGSTLFYPQTAPNDDVRVVGDGLAREEVFVKPASWMQFAGGLDLRAGSHDHVGDSWRLDFSDRTRQRPRLAVRRLTATLTHRALTLDAGKQFIRWGKTDIVTPTDRFAPRDFLTVVDNEFLAVTGARAVVQAGRETLDAVWVPRLTPSRLPLTGERWTPIPPAAVVIPILDANPLLPTGSQVGFRWSHVGSAIELSASLYHGFNHLPNLSSDPRSAAPVLVIRQVFPSIRTYGVDAAMPTRWFTIKGEAAYFTSTTSSTDEYVLYVAQLERQTGEWMLIGGYAGEAVTTRRAAITFAPDRGLTRSIVARASYTIDPNRSVAFETAVRQNGDGVYAKTEYSRTRGQHWRATVTGVIIAGHEDDFLGQYHRNSHAAITLRYSF